MKILYVSPYLDGSGYSKASIDYILAMDSVGLDVVPRPIKLNNVYDKVPARLLELEAKPQLGCDVCIQHTLPSHWEYNGSYKNIGLFAWETDRLPPRSSWVEKCNMMDEVWVINDYMAKVLLFDGVRARVRVIPHAVNTEKFKGEYPLHEKIQNIYKGDYTFYTIAENNRRKNLEGLLRAFHAEFDPSEPVQLVVKTNNSLDNLNAEVIEGLKLYKPEHYKRPISLLGTASEASICSLHQHSDCFVSTSYGEAFCLPAYDAIGFGKRVIVPDSTSFRSLPREVANKVEVYTKPCYKSDSLPDLYTAEESWFEPCQYALQVAMRQAFEFRNKSFPRCNDYIEGFSYHNIGNLIKSSLYDSRCNDTN